MAQKQKTVFIHASYVCERGKTDAEKIAQYFVKNGYTIIYNPKKADIIIFNSCGYSNPIAKQCLKTIQKYKQYPGELIVVGGLPDTDTKKYNNVFTGKTLSHNMLDTIDTFFPQHPVSFKDISDCNHSWLTLDESHLRGKLKNLCVNFDLTKTFYSKLYDFYFSNTIGPHYMILSNPLDIPTQDIFRIEIARGCSFKCTYCAIRKSVGPFYSKPVTECIGQFEKGLKQGHTLFYITAPDPGCYGTDIHTTYPALLEKFLTFPGSYQIGLDGLNPIWLVRYINNLKKLPHHQKIAVLCIPIQSGNTRILQMMHRYYDIKKIIKALVQLKETYPHIRLATNCIVGFPSETEQEFEDTLLILQKGNFDMGFVNPISIKQNTSAASMPSQISPDVIRKRIKKAQTFLKQLGYYTHITKTGGVVFGRKTSLYPKAMKKPISTIKHSTGINEKHRL